MCDRDRGIWDVERERPFKANWSDDGRPVHTLASSCIHTCRWVKL